MKKSKKEAKAELKKKRTEIEEKTNTEINELNRKLEGREAQAQALAEDKAARILKRISRSIWHTVNTV